MKQPTNQTCESDQTVGQTIPPGKPNKRITRYAVEPKTPISQRYWHSAVWSARSAETRRNTDGYETIATLNRKNPGNISPPQSRFSHVPVLASGKSKQPQQQRNAPQNTILSEHYRTPRRYARRRHLPTTENQRGHHRHH